MLLKKNNCYIADLDGEQIRYDSHDGAHPTKIGHIEMSRAWIQCLNKQPDIINNEKKTLY